jgi:hypothetical protein
LLTRKNIYLFLAAITILAGCVTPSGNRGLVQIFDSPLEEAQWIQNGKPLEFEKEDWYPVDALENIMDAEVRLMGDYEGVQFFTLQEDVRPYSRLYTKFGINKFRAFERRE